jgi:hypothetical protein
MTRIDDLAKQLRVLIADVNRMLEEGVPRLNKTMSDVGLQILNPGKKIGHRRLERGHLVRPACGARSYARAFFALRAQAGRMPALRLLILRHARIDFV